MLDVECFRYKKNAFVVKELAITTSDYSDRLIFFLPPVNFNILPKLEQKAYNWLTNYLHGLHWENGDYLHINLNRILQIFVFRNHSAVFYAKRKEKTEFLAKYLDRKVENLDDLGCHWVENLFFKNFPSCNRHIPHYNYRNHCALKKSKVFLDWLKNEQQREVSESGDIPITKFNASCVDDCRG